ncbi:hypothetical protein OG828_48990 [Streptomyces sp. NBC_00457]|uniref:SbcC/MukB-like Walker B domain-containing protein n=1 Tax=Streptomyces sp. NBC_00457 TaxID=2975748 RepID=UPI002E1F15F1
MHRGDTHIDPGKQHILDRHGPHTWAIPTRNVPAVARRPGDSRNRGQNQLRDRPQLQQLSGGRLDFAANFDIVNLASHARRSSRTLSGGETFQASLALSLALMEMHGRSRTRLESLFLDEGFGTLDTASLDSALQVLRTHVGSDKLLAVISHLRPVAETVHDVLWVEKDHHGSRAHWLSAADRDTLIRGDLHNLTDLA